jgi:proton-translocating NADH-quinone oxidoreductase chain M
MLNYIFIVLFFGIFLTSFSQDKKYSKICALTTSLIVLILSVELLTSFKSNVESFQHVVVYKIDNSFLNFVVSFGLDGVSIYFFYLTALLIFLCIVFIINENKFKDYAVNLLLIELFLCIIFSVLDLMIFYIFFEAILVPMYLLIGIWGSRERKIRAVYLFFFYTLCSSLLFLISILYIYNKTGSLSLEYLMTVEFTFTEQLFLWSAFFLSFASKIPMFPFHIWLPEAHVEAPTVGSVLLAGILLKLGVYGLLRFNLTVFADASFYFSPLVYLMSCIGVVYASLAALRQTDLKRIIAYSSVAHMNLVTLGIFSFNSIGVEGAIVQSISHGFVSGGLFFLIGIVYNRYHTRYLYYYGGIVHYMPIYSATFLVFTLANIALPTTSSFVGEFLILSGIYKTNVVTGIIAALGVILSGAYSLWLYNKMTFGNLKVTFLSKFQDINFREFFIMFPLFIYIVILGIFPSYFTQNLHFVVNTLCLA